MGAAHVTQWAQADSASAIAVHPITQRNTSHWCTDIIMTSQVQRRPELQAGLLLGSHKKVDCSRKLSGKSSAKLGCAYQTLPCSETHILEGRHPCHLPLHPSREHGAARRVQTQRPAPARTTRWWQNDSKPRDPCARRPGQPDDSNHCGRTASSQSPNHQCSSATMPTAPSTRRLHLVWSGVSGAAAVASAAQGVSWSRTAETGQQGLERTCYATDCCHEQPRRALAGCREQLVSGT